MSRASARRIHRRGDAARRSARRPEAALRRTRAPTICWWRRSAPRWPQVPGARCVRGDRGRDHRLRDSRGRARPERRAQRGAAGRSAEFGRRRHGQPLLLVGPERGGDGSRPHPRRRGRRDDRRRRESMSMVPMIGNKPSFNPHIFDSRREPGIAYGMGITAEKVAERWKVSREAQDAFALASHERAIAAQQGRRVQRRDHALRGRRPNGSRIWHAARCRSRRATIALDEGPRADTNCEGAGQAAGRCSPRKGSVTAGNSSQTSDGAGALIAGQRKDAEAVQPDAAGALRLLRGARRAAGDHGHRAEGSDSGGSERGRFEAGRHRLDRAERGVRGASRWR